jgi:RNA polymerase sigma-70 factor (ECF subfamily)
MRARASAHETLGRMTALVILVRSKLGGSRGTKLNIRAYYAVLPFCRGSVVRGSTIPPSCVMTQSGVALSQTSSQPAGSAPRDATLNYEAALLECAAGHQSAVGRIYALEGNRLREVARRIVRDRAHAEDVIHDAFAQILRDAKSFDPSRGSARAWIYAIVRNTALKSYQNASREVAVEDGELLSMCNQQHTVADPSSRIAENAALRSCIEELEPRRRASLILAIIDGRTHAEIAKYLGVPIGTIKAWIRRELIALRERLK